MINITLFFRIFNAFWHSSKLSVSEPKKFLGHKSDAMISLWQFFSRAILIATFLFKSNILSTPKKVELSIGICSISVFFYYLRERINLFRKTGCYWSFSHPSTPVSSVVTGKYATCTSFLSRGPCAELSFLSIYERVLRSSIMLNTPSVSLENSHSSLLKRRATLHF